MTGTDDYVPFLVQEPSNFGYRQGLVAAWNGNTNTNQITVAGSTLNNLPVISASDVFNIRVGDAVAVIKYNDSYAILGRIKAVGSGSLWTHVPLYPLFIPLIGAGVSGYWSVNVGTSASWEGRIFATHHTLIHVDGIWGTASGANTSTYQVILGGVVVGTWTSGSLDVSNKGPYDISQFRDQAFLKVEVKLASSVGSGTVALQVLGCFLR